ncbi:Cadmium-induced protein CadI [compost metagenome]
MKRFHVHLHVDDLPKSIGFYSRLFAQDPARIESDYAKWMLDDPPVNFAISTRGGAAGVDHFGIQAENPDELVALRSRAESASLALEDQGETSCCYARSEKYWITDPQGVAWEHFHTLGTIPVYGESHRDALPTGAASACCSPSASPTVQSNCCVPNTTSSARCC